VEHPLRTLARELTKKYFGNALRVGRYFIFDPKGQAQHQGRVILIMRGYFLDPEFGRLSNHWTWRYIRPDGSLGQGGSGYGGNRSFFRPVSKKTALTYAAR
jgi:hypothetical protein